ncbi:tyrosine-type recombinase/integrase [Nocardia tengchongensis]|uniref:tyrosine-type recombinase/integrase n=1 Tax=Nocardia tengchongensis TaxID=2055889 RepID=UPI003677A1C9
MTPAQANSAPPLDSGPQSGGPGGGATAHPGGPDMVGERGTATPPRSGASVVAAHTDTDRLVSGDAEIRGSRRTRGARIVLLSADSAPPPGRAPQVDAADRDRVDARRAQSKAANTVTGYETSWRRWTQWCAERGAEPLPAHPGLLDAYAEAVAAYLAVADAALAADGTPAYAVATLEAWGAAITHFYTAAGLASPVRARVVAETMTGIRKRRTKAGIGPDKAAPLLAHTLTTIVTAIDADAVGWKAKVAARRDTALLVIQFAAALRRSELVPLWISDIRRLGDPEDRYLQVRIRGSKRSPTAMEYVAMARGEHAITCPWCAVLRWQAVLAAFDRAVATAERRGGTDPAAAGQHAVVRVLDRDATSADLHVCDRDWPSFQAKDVPLLRPLDADGLPHAQAITRPATVPDILKRRAAQAGLDPAEVEKLSGHSARSGAATGALSGGADIHTVAKHLRHRDIRSTHGYDQSQPWAGNTAADHLGL